MTPAKDIAAHYKGVDIPNSPFLNEVRINRINAGRYEGQEVAGGLAIVKKGDRILEMGAGLGFVGAVISKNCEPTRVISYEANPALIPHIQKLYEMNGLADVNEVRNQVLISNNDRPNTLPFAIHNSFLGSSLDGDVTRAKEIVDVETADFHAVVDDLKPQIMMIDIEGGELALFEHANFDRLRDLRGIVIEFHPEIYEVKGMRRCKDLLRAAGFERVDELSTRTVWVAERTV